MPESTSGPYGEYRMPSYPPPPRPVPRVRFPPAEAAALIDAMSGTSPPRPDVPDELTALIVPVLRRPCPRCDGNHTPTGEDVHCSTCMDSGSIGPIYAEAEAVEYARDVLAAVLPAHARMVREQAAAETRSLARKWAANAQASSTLTERERRFAVANVLTGHPDRTPTGDLRERIVGALTEEARQHCRKKGIKLSQFLETTIRASAESRADAVLPIFEAALAEQRRRLRAVPDEHRCESVHPDGRRQCTRASGHVAHVNGGDGWSCACDVNTQRAEQAEAAVQRVRDLAASLHDGVLVRRFLAALNQPEETPDA